MPRIHKTLSLMVILAVIAAGATAMAADTAPAAPAAPAQSTKKEMKLEDKRKEIDKVTSEALAELFKGNPRAKELNEKAYGYAVFDNLKLGFILSGSGGKGEAVVKKTGKKTYMAMGSGGVGLTVGGQQSQIIFLFADSTTFNDFVNKGWAATGSASAAAGPAGAGATSNFVNGVAYYQIGTNGIMATADIAGTKYWKDKDLN